MIVLVLRYRLCMYIALLYIHPRSLCEEPSRKHTRTAVHRIRCARKLLQSPKSPADLVFHPQSVTCYRSKVLRPKKLGNDHLQSFKETDLLKGFHIGRDRINEVTRRV